MSSPLLSHYGIIIIDCVLERTVPTDVLLGLLKDIVILRPELKLIIITSLQLSSKLQAYFDSVPLIRVGSQFQTEVAYTSGIQKDYFLSALRLLFDIHNSRRRGDVVIFLACEQVSNLISCRTFQYACVIFVAIKIHTRYSLSEVGTHFILNEK